MDFTLSLTHFCEVHGPKSILCTQVLPLECALCAPSPPLRPQISSESLITQIHERINDDRDDFMTQSAFSSRTARTTSTLPTDFSGASTTIDSEPDSPIVEQPRFHKAEEQKKGIDPQFRYGRAQGDTCASCVFTIPQAVASQLPRGAPGSSSTDERIKHTAPVLRSRETVCLGSHDSMRKRRSHGGQSSSQESNTSSFHSGGSQHSNSDCHDHTLTYLTTKSPDDPDNYAQLRGSVIRTLSCEQLPKGTSDGRLWFGDDENGYTIAYVFRLTDPRARGRIRAYAFVALAGKNASRAFKASPMLWEAFGTMASRIEERAQRYQEEQQKKEEEENKRKNYTSVTSFLTQKTSQTVPRSLADIVGDENIFAILHQYFVAVLRCLGDQFGGLPMAAETSVYRSLADEQDGKSKNVHTTVVGQEDQDLGAFNDQQPEQDEAEHTKQKLNKKLQRNSQCGPLMIDATATGQVVI